MAEAAHPTTTWTTSVCVGSLTLGAAGLLEEVRATTHRVAHDLLTQFEAALRFVALRVLPPSLAFRPFQPLGRTFSRHTLM
ncbi:hypothetical protein AB0F88_24695 [Streptosporangium sp. NPDC023963]|uniref:hypothetical protein n=1 Tax=Streptosporangium sp. NPDC023963 TaxID=3155608 RepID=UPI00344840C4